MKKILSTAFVLVVVATVLPTLAQAAPDQYLGDTSIYGGASAGAVQPNVLIILDTSGSMDDTVPGGSYDPNTTYPVTNNCGSGGGGSDDDDDHGDKDDKDDDDHGGSVACSTNAVYTSSYTLLNASVNNITTSCNGANPRNLLQTTGQYNGRSLTSSGACNNSGSSTYLLGNYINWLFGAGTPRAKIAIARDVVKNLITSTSGAKIGLMKFHNTGSGHGSQAEGSQFISNGGYITTIKDMNAIFSGSTTNRQALVLAVDTLSASGSTPLAESLFEAMRYFTGGTSAFGNTIGVSGGSYTSPIEYACQKNYIIFVTDGMSTADNSNILRTICNNGDCDADGAEQANLSHAMDDVAKYLYETDLSPDGSGGYPGVQNAVTYTIGFGLGGADQDAVDLLNRTADSTHGRGQALLAGSEQQLSVALTSVLSQIFAVNASFVAPVAPVSPESRTRSGSRIYMGFFKPQTGTHWFGNLKKYALDTNDNLVDATGAYANYADLDGNNVDDRDSATLPDGATNGTFRTNARSYWSTAADGADVDRGGAGGALLTRDFSAAPRSIYTYLGSSTALTNSSNAFTTSNTNITTTTLGVSTDTDKNKLINFIHGIDSYDGNLNGNTTEKRSWIFGDVLHSKSQIIHYSSYTYSTSNEANCNTNKTIIYVCSNDGMLHAIKDCDGSEAWAFVPPNLLARLTYLSQSAHTYFVDAAASVYVFDNNSNGNIETPDSSGVNDKVILIVGQRRGGGASAAPTNGYYYAIDITNPASPVYLWSISSATSGFSELGESWSEPKIVKMKIGGNNKIVAFIGGGYDNLNEDGRYGATQTFTGTATVNTSALGDGAVTSSGSASQLTPRGRGIYAIEVASLSSSGLSLGSSGTKIWGYTNAESSSIQFPIVSELSAIDFNYDTNIDRLYAGDTGGNIWRIYVGDPSTSNWTVTKIFSLNPGADSLAGKKIFYKPSAVVDTEGVRLYVGTGDREHPLNLSVVDRMYGLIDKGQSTAKTETSLLDVTTDLLQSGSDSQVATILSTLASADNFGWYIKLNENAGEKVLAEPTVFNKVVYFTTFSPQTESSSDPCHGENLGTARVYALSYKTGEAAINYLTSNDGTYSSITNKRAKPTSGRVLLRGDRVVSAGSGIPSGVALIMSRGGDVSAFVGAGGGIRPIQAKQGGRVKTLYWRQR